MQRACLAAVTILFGWTASASIVGAEADQPCGSVGDAALREAVALGEAYIARSWASRGPDLIATYDTPEVRRNPFATKTDVSGATAIYGRVWARDVNCVVFDDQRDHLVKLTYKAAEFRFNDAGNRWTKPLKSGVLIALELRQNNGQWLVSDRSAHFSVLLPEAVLHLPKPNEMPDQAAWPDKRCPPPKKWQGKDCVSPEPKSYSETTERPDAD